jgi:TolA-binding protein
MAMLAACASVGSWPAEQEDAHLHQGRHLLAQGDFAGALRENQKVLARFPRTPPGDTALFNIGMIHLHYTNPKRDIGQARIFFTRLIEEFPGSPRAEEARILDKTLESLNNTEHKHIESEEKKRELPMDRENADLQRGQQLLARGDFAGALRTNQVVLARYPQTPPGDEALFTMGLIHVHYANPKRDIGQAHILFARLMEEFPESPRTEEARIWVGILETMEKTRQIDIEIEEKKRELRR